ASESAQSAFYSQEGARASSLAAQKSTEAAREYAALADQRAKQAAAHATWTELAAGRADESAKAAGADAVTTDMLVRTQMTNDAKNKGLVGPIHATEAKPRPHVLGENDSKKPPY